MVERIDIERALEEIISNEEGMRFQNLAVVLAKLRWPELIACERHKDRGLDAYASPTLSSDGKGKGLACSTTPTLTKISKDAKAATKHYEGLAILIFATPAKVTKETEEPWRKDILEEFGLELVVMSREDIITSLQLPHNAGICRSHLMLTIPYQQPLADVVRQVREAAAALTATAAERFAGRPQITLTVAVQDDRGDTPERFPARDVGKLLLQGRRVILEAPAGRGKTTTLVHIAQACAETEGIPIQIDLPAWVRSRSDILDFTALHPAFRGRGVRADDLARVASANPFLFLLNGWNEVAEAYADDAVTALAALEREFPTAGIVVATRAHHVRPPLPGAVKLQLLPLTARERAAYVGSALAAEQARELQAQLDNDPVLDEVTRTPFILAEITSLFSTGQAIPRTTFGVLAAIVRMSEQAEHHRGALETLPLLGRAGEYLRALAMALTARGAVLIDDAEARTICAAVSEQLRVAGQIATPPEPSLILATLVSHHILERVEYPRLSFRFEHQQFQEYYAAAALRDTLLSIVERDDATERDAFARQYLNVPAWEEALDMLADDLGDSVRDVAVGRVLIEGALRIDPVLAACLARLSGPHVWTQVRAAAHERLRALYASSDPHHQLLAVAAMLATANEEFADIIVPLLTSADQQLRLATYRAGPHFYPTSVGAEWQAVVASWSEQHRMEFMSHLTMDHGHLNVASTLARTDRSFAVRREGIRLLLWMRQRDDAAGLLRSVPDAEFVQTIDDTDLGELPPDLRTRALELYAERFASTDDARARFQLALRLAEQGDAEGASRLKQALADLSAALVRELSNYSLRRAVDIVRSSDEPWVSEWVARWIAEGALWSGAWLPFVTAIPAALREELFRRAADEVTPGDTVSVLAATADPAFARRAFEAFREQRQSLHADPQNERAQTLERRLDALVRAIRVHTLVEGLSAILGAAPRDEDVDVLLRIFGDGRQRDEVDRELPDAAREQLRAYFRSAVATVLAREDFRGDAKAYLATALAEVGRPEDTDDVLALLRADIERVRTGRELLHRGVRTPQSNGASMGYASWHVQALVRLDPARAEPILRELLAQPEYELDAAWALRTLAKRDLGARRTIDGRFGGPRGDYRTVRQTPRGWAILFDAGRRATYARAIRERIAQILEESRRAPDTARANQWRAKELAKPLAALDPHDSADLILEVAAIPFDVDRWTAVGLLESLALGGATLDADRALVIVEPVVEHLRTRGTYNDNAGLVQRMACVLPFVEPAVRGVARARALLTEFPLPSHEQRDVLIALGQCADEDGIALLCEIARQSGTNFQYIARDWLAAVAASPHPRARQVLLSSIDPDVPDGIGDLALPDDAASTLAEILADIARRDRNVAARLFELCSMAPAAQARMILAKVCAHLGMTDALYAGLDLLDDAGVPPIPYDLIEAAEGLFLEKRPSRQIANAYSLVPRAAGDVRARLFEMAQHDDRRKRSAADLLARIEGWRLEHGRPPSEPRHPAYESGTSWPLPTDTAVTPTQ